MPFASRMTIPGCCIPLSRVMRPIGRSCADSERATSTKARPRDRFIEASLQTDPYIDIECQPQGVAMRSRLVLVVALALIGLPLFGQSNDVTLFVGSSRVGTTHSGGTDIHFDRGDSIGVSLNHFFSSRFSGELGVFVVRHDGSLRIG